ncbi:hypothetical protein IKE99_00800 [Candidatus Saccharibacteria bacterium]|nr:hypothetical protein [Candidatus Saccharibacteria bacterium]
MNSLNLKQIKRELKIDARGLNIPSGSAEIFIDRTLETVSQKFKDRAFVTEKDLKNTIAKELSKYHKDFAYVYKNRDKII